MKELVESILSSTETGKKAFGNIYAFSYDDEYTNHFGVVRAKNFDDAAKILHREANIRGSIQIIAFNEKDIFATDETSEVEWK